MGMFMLKKVFENPYYNIKGKHPAIIAVEEHYAEFT